MLIVIMSAAIGLSCSTSRLRYFEYYYCLLMKNSAAVAAIFRSALVGGSGFDKDRMFDLSDLLTSLNQVRTNFNASILFSVTTSSSFRSAKIKRFSLKFAEAFLKSVRDRAC